ncbi:hypothetical protein OIO90_003888 [Microbotryomycetes sp. JL221]|nr:hypothetical protein OIO90_003888 [Microbotryomycetes sp. JL221]
MLDKLVQHVLEDMAMDGEAGINFARLEQIVQDFYNPKVNQTLSTGAIQNIDQPFLKFVWSTLCQQSDVRVGYIGVAGQEGGEEQQRGNSDDEGLPNSQHESSTAKQHQHQTNQVTTNNPQAKGKARALDAKPTSSTDAKVTLIELDRDERSLPAQALLDKYGDNLRLAADPEATWIAITGSSARPGPLTAPVYRMLQIVSRERGEGATVITIGRSMGIDQKSAFHLVRVAVNLGIVKKIRALAHGSWTNRIIHNRYLSVSPHWAIHTKNDEEDNPAVPSTSQQAADGGQPMSEDELDQQPRFIRMSALSATHLATNPKLVRRRIVKMLKMREGQVMPHSQLAPSVGFWSYTKHELRRFNALISRMCDDGVLEKTMIAYGDDDLVMDNGDDDDDDGDGDGGQKGVKSVKLIANKDVGDETTETVKGEPVAAEDDFDADDAPKVLALVPIERQIIDIVAQSDSDGVLLSEIASMLSNYSIRAISMTISRLCRSADTIPEQADLDIVAQEENLGRERRTRYFTTGGFVRRCRRDKVDEAIVKPYVDKLRDDRLGELVPKFDSNKFYATVKQRRDAVDKYNFVTFSKMKIVKRVQRPDPWTATTSNRGRPRKSGATATAIESDDEQGRAKTLKVNKGKRKADATGDNEAEGDDSNSTKTKRTKSYKNVDSDGNPILGRPRKQPKLDKDGNPILSYYERRKLENERRKSMGLEPIEKGPLFKLDQSKTTKSAREADNDSEADYQDNEGLAATEQGSTASTSQATPGPATVTVTRSNAKNKRRLDETSAAETQELREADDGNAPVDSTVSRGRGRPRKQVRPDKEQPQPVASTSTAAPVTRTTVASTSASAPDAPPVPVKRRRGQLRKSSTAANMASMSPNQDQQGSNTYDDQGEVEPEAIAVDARERSRTPVAEPVPAVKRGRGLRRKTAVQPTGLVDEARPVEAPVTQTHVSIRDAEEEGPSTTAAAAAQEGAPEEPQIEQAAPSTSESGAGISIPQPVAVSKVKIRRGRQTSRPALPGKIKVNLTSVARQADIVAYLKHNNGFAASSQILPALIASVASEDGKPKTTMDRRVLEQELEVLIKSKKVIKTTVSLPSGRRDLLILPGTDQGSQEFKDFLRELNGRPKGTISSLPVLSGVATHKATVAAAAQVALPSVDDDPETIRAFFKSNQAILSHMYGCAYGRVARARHLHKVMIEYIANHDIDTFCLSKQPNILDPAFVTRAIKLGDWLRIVPLAVDSEELETFVSNKENLEWRLQDVPEHTLHIIKPTSAARQKSLWKVVEVLIHLGIILPLVPALDDHGQPIEGAFTRPNRDTSASHWQLSATVPIYSFKYLTPRLVEVAHCTTPQEVEQFWITLRDASFSQEKGKLQPIKHDTFKSTLPENKTFNRIMASGTKWYSGYKLLEPQKTFLSAVVATKPDGFKEKDEMTRLARLVCAPASNVMRYIMQQAQTGVPIAEGGNKENEGLAPDSTNDGGQLTGNDENDEFGMSLNVIINNSRILIDDERSNEFNKLYEDFVREHDGFSLPDKTIDWLRERYSRLRHPMDDDELDNELTYWNGSPNVADYTTIVPRKYQPKASTRRRPVVQGMQEPHAGARDGAAGDQLEGAMADYTVVKKLSSEEQAELHARLYGHDRQHEFLTGPIKTLPKEMKRMPRTQFNEEQDTLIIEAGAVIQARASLTGRRHTWTPFEQLFGGFTADHIRRRFKALASKSENSNFVVNLTEEWAQLLVNKKGTPDVPDDDLSELVDFDIADHIKSMRHQLDMAALRRSGPRHARAQRFLPSVTLPSTLAELEEQFVYNKSAATLTDVSARWPKLNKSTTSSVLRELELVENAFSAPCHQVKQDMSRDVRLAADAVKVVTCMPSDVYSEPCATKYLEPLLPSLEPAVRMLENRSVILKRGKEHRRLPGRNFVMNERFMNQLQGSLSTNRIRQANETETTLREGAIEWPVIAEDGDMIALFRLVSDNQIELKIDTSVSEHLRPPDDYQTRAKDDEALENLIEVMAPAEVEIGQQSDLVAVVPPPLLPEGDFTPNADELVKARKALDKDKGRSSKMRKALELLDELNEADCNGLQLAKVEARYKDSTIVKRLTTSRPPLAFIAGDNQVSLVHSRFFEQWSMATIRFDTDTVEKEVAIEVADSSSRRRRQRKTDVAPPPVEQTDQGQPLTRIVQVTVRMPLQQECFGKRMYPSLWTDVYGDTNPDMWRKALSWVQDALLSRTHSTLQQLFAHSESACLLTMQEIMFALQQLWSHGFIKAQSPDELVQGEDDSDRRLDQDRRNVNEIDWYRSRWSLSGAWYRA